ncbi:MAG: 50S rRNA methyltransferase, partial [Parachlamydiales bacterium]
MLKINLVSVGKTKEKWLQTALLEYEKRLRGQAVFVWQLFKTEKLLENHLENLEKFILLDSSGELLESRQQAH